MQKKDFDPNAVAQHNTGIFGLSYTTKESKVILIPAPWGVTVSYGGGTHDGPKAIYEASPQIDYYHEAYGPESWKLPVAMLPLLERKNVYTRGKQLRTVAEKYIKAISNGKKGDTKKLAEINVACEVFHDEIKEEALDALRDGKLVGLIGGDHSTPLGLMKALAEEKGDFGILQIDAHCDLREAYEGFVYSHASIMWNALHQIHHIKKLVQVGIRDYSPSEYDFIKNSNGRVETFFDDLLKSRQFRGETWESIVKNIVSKLPGNVYLSFDIDGLEPSLCPGTGTPVPGGLTFHQAIYLIESVVKSGRTIIGFDLNEVSPQPGDSEWNANVGMRILWNMVLWAAKSNRISIS
jgi:agmatinase